MLNKHLLLVFGTFLLVCIIMGQGCSDNDVDPYTPVLSIGDAASWDDTSIIGPWVYYDSGSYTMYYSGSTNDNKFQIGHAVSSDGIVWIKTPAPSVPYGADTTWSESGVYGASVVSDGTDLHMFFIGYNDLDFTQVGYASNTTGDPADWIVQSAPVLSPTGIGGDFDEDGITDISVFYDAGTFRIWYAGKNSANKFSIGYTDTADPLVISNAAAALDSLKPLDESYLHNGARAPAVILNGAQYEMWPTVHNATRYIITMAISTQPDDLWQINVNPVLGITGAGFDANQVGFCSVIKHPTDTGYQMWYSGFSNNWKGIGYAVSEFGAGWSKYRE